MIHNSCLMKRPQVVEENRFAVQAAKDVLASRDKNIKVATSGRSCALRKQREAEDKAESLRKQLVAANHRERRLRESLIEHQPTTTDKVKSKKKKISELVREQDKEKRRMEYAKGVLKDAVRKRIHINSSVELTYVCI